MQVANFSQKYFDSTINKLPTHFMEKSCIKKSYLKNS